jgi:hypothetical protein
LKVDEEYYFFGGKIWLDKDDSVHSYLSLTQKKKICLHEPSSEHQSFLKISDEIYYAQLDFVGGVSFRGCLELNQEYSFRFFGPFMIENNGEIVNSGYLLKKFDSYGFPPSKRHSQDEEWMFNLDILKELGLEEPMKERNLYQIDQILTFLYVGGKFSS